MYLVDTSVWIDFFRARDTLPVRRLTALLPAGADVCVTPEILQEILQGACDVPQFEKYRRYFTSQPILTPRDAVQSAIAAARMYFDCRRRGITVRSSNDCLIAQLAVEHNAALLHDDTDFESIAKVAPGLRQLRG